jgi:hypothetical protein
VRKLWYAGAVVAGGIALFGATPAQADLLPGSGTAEQQADERLADLLGQSNGVTMENPLRYSTLGQTPLGSPPLMQFKAGQNSPDLKPVLPGESGSEDRPGLPAADVVGGALQQPVGAGPVRRLNMPQLPLERVFGFGLFDGLLADGAPSSFLQRPTMRQAEAFDGGVPLLGGLGGVLPVNDLPDTAPAGTKPDTSGLPAGGLAVLPAAGAAPSTGQTTPSATTPAAGATPSAAQSPATGQPVDAPTAGQSATPTQQPTPAATPDDPRLHEEPVDDEAAHRQFSPNGRPVAGIDQQYK